MAVERDDACSHAQGEIVEPAVSVVMAQLVSLFQLRRYAELESKARTLVERNPTTGVFWKVLGVSLKMQGKDALLALQKASDLLPHDPEAHYNLANAAQELGRFADAEAGYRRTLAIAPDFAEAHNNLGNILQGFGRFDEAATCFRRALHIQPEYAEGHYNLGNVLTKLGQLDDAVASYKRSLKIRPDFAEGHNNLGNVLQDIGSLDAAVASFRHVLQISPGHAEGHNNLGNVLRELRQLDAAVASCCRAIEIKPDFAEAHVNLGIALRLQSRFAEAEASCRRALALNPALAVAIIFKADLHADRGQFTEAEASYRRAISIEPESPKAWAGIAGVRKMTHGDDTWLKAVHRIAEQNLPPRQEVYLRYAIGKYFDDVQHFEQAFLNYRRANELSKLYGRKFERRHLALMVDFLTSTYDADWMRRQKINAVHASRSERPVFIVGMPRSGTSLAEQILASHPDGCGAGELTFWKDTAPTHGASLQISETNEAGGMRERGLRKTADDYLRLLDGFSPGALRVVDKMPANFMYLGLMHAAFPHARIIHMQRDPIDTCLSIYFQHLNTAHSYANDLEDLASYYTEYVRAMEHWRATLPRDAILHVPYEGLVEDQEGWSRAMLKFIGLPWDDHCMDFHNNARAVGTVSNWQVRQSIGKSSVQRWRNYEKFVGPLLKLMASRQ